MHPTVFTHTTSPTQLHRAYYKPLTFVLALHCFCILLDIGMSKCAMSRRALASNPKCIYVQTAPETPLFILLAIPRGSDFGGVYVPSLLSWELREGAVGAQFAVLGGSWALRRTALGNWVLARGRGPALLANRWGPVCCPGDFVRGPCGPSLLSWSVRGRFVRGPREPSWLSWGVRMHFTGQPWGPGYWLRGGAPPSLPIAGSPICCPEGSRALRGTVLGPWFLPWGLREGALGALWAHCVSTRSRPDVDTELP